MYFQGRSPPTIPDCDSFSHFIYLIPFTLSTYCVYYLWKVNSSSLYLRNSSLFNSECLFILKTQPSFLLRVFSSSETHLVHVASSASELISLSFSTSLHPHFLSLSRSAFLFILRTHPSFPLNISSSSEAQPSFFPYASPSSELIPPHSPCLFVLIYYTSLALHFSLSSELIHLSLSMSLHSQKLNSLYFRMSFHPQKVSFLSSCMSLHPQNSSFSPSAHLFISRTRPSLPLHVSLSSVSHPSLHVTLPLIRARSESVASRHSLVYYSLKRH